MIVLDTAAYLSIVRNFPKCLKLHKRDAQFLSKKKIHLRQKFIARNHRLLDAEIFIFVLTFVVKIPSISHLGTSGYDKKKGNQWTDNEETYFRNKLK